MTAVSKHRAGAFRGGRDQRSPAARGRFARSPSPALVHDARRSEPVRTGAVAGAIASGFLVGGLLDAGGPWWAVLAFLTYMAPALVLLGMALTGRVGRLWGGWRSTAAPLVPAAERRSPTSSLDGRGAADLR